jgi:hypothetical protein
MLGASHFREPTHREAAPRLHPKSLSQGGRGTLNPAPLLPFWEKGLGDEGHKFAKMGCSRNVFGEQWGDRPLSSCDLTVRFLES